MLDKLNYFRLECKAGNTKMVDEFEKLVREDERKKCEKSAPTQKEKEAYIDGYNDGLEGKELKENSKLKGGD